MTLAVTFFIVASLCCAGLAVWMFRYAFPDGWGGERVIGWLATYYAVCMAIGAVVVAAAQ